MPRASSVRLFIFDFTKQLLMIIDEIIEYL